MEVIDTTSSLRLAIMLEMIEEVSRVQDPQEAAIAFGSRMHRLRRTDYLVSISTRNLSKGVYKITRAYDPAAYHNRDPLQPSVGVKPINPWREWDTLATHTGGFIGEIIDAPEPRLLHNLSIRNDPALGDSLAEMGSAIAIPLYDAGKAVNWSFQFRRDPQGYTEEDLEQVLLTGNLFGAMTRNLVNLDRINSLNGQLRAQFEEVARVQQALLPKRLPKIPGLKISTSYLTSDQAGGDYYDFFPLSDGRWGILVADVAGHGAGAATVMAMLHAILHAYPDLDAGPAEALRFANSRLIEAQMDSSFTTAVFAVYDPATREFTYARAGHPEPRIKDTRTGKVSVLDGAGTLPLGIVENYEVPQATVRLEPGQTVVLYTDGITEAFNKGREMFGAEGLDLALERCTGEAYCVVDSVYSALYEHTGSMTRADDQTLVVLQVVD